MIPIASTGISVTADDMKTFRFSVLATTPGEITIIAEIEDDDPDVDMTMHTVLVNQRQTHGRP